VLNRTLVCVPTPKGINAKPSLSVKLGGINTERNAWLLKKIEKIKGVVRVHGVSDNPDVIVVQVRMTNILFKTAFRVHRLLQELLEEQLILDRSALRPNARPAKSSRAAEVIHRNPSTT
jgi:hypothetical protein